MSANARHLRPVGAGEEPIPAVLVDPATGQTWNLADRVLGLEDALAGAERDLNTWRRRHADLLRDKEAEARESELWPAALEVFDHWRAACRHPRAEWTYDRFELIRPHLERSGTGKGKAKKLTVEQVRRNVEICKLAVDALAFDPFTTRGKNGRPIVHDGLHLAFADADTLEARCKKAPAERIREVFPPAPEKAASDAAGAPVAGQQRLG